MNDTLTHSDNFTASYTESVIAPGITVVHITADAKGEASTLSVRFSCRIPSIGVHTIWAPLDFTSKRLVSNWGRYFGSCAMSGAPVTAALAYDDENRITLACSDAKNSVELHHGFIEESGLLDVVCAIRVDCAVSHYEADVRIDQRHGIKFYEAVADVAKWWETYDGYAPAFVPEDARMPLYSAWYSYHQQVDVPAIVEECRRFAKTGCRVLIIDDGWQTDDNARGYDYCGDWRPTTSKVPSMKAFVDAVHETGMKFMLWYAVPLVGEYADAYARFKDKMLCSAGGKTHVLDPRYPEVREYLINRYKNAVLDWGLDGFKLDFVDSFRQSGTVCDGMDYVSVYDAVDRLLKDIMATLRTLKPDILIEFRQSYIGPLMRSFGNMLRVADCPGDSFTNRIGIAALRMTSGGTAVHSDMVTWHYDETPEQAAFQLTNILFGVPQISTKWHCMTEAQQKMVSYLLGLWCEYRDTILHGKMLYHDYASNYPYISARSENTQIGAVYAGKMAYIEEPTDEIVLINASLDHTVFLCAADGGIAYRYDIYDCMGNRTGEGILTLDGDGLSIPGIPGVPVNGVVKMKRTNK